MCKYVIRVLAILGAFWSEAFSLSTVVDIDRAFRLLIALNFPADD